MHISTSPRGQRFQQAVGMFRMEEARPFEPGLFGFQGQALRPGATRARTAPAATIGAYTDSETKSLIPRRAQAQRMDLSNAITLCAAVSLWFMIVAVIGVMYWSFTSNVASLRDSAQPFVMEAVNRTMSIMRHADESSIGVNDVVDGAVSITNAAVPALAAAMNQTSRMIDRLEALAKNPVLQLSLTNGVMGGVGGAGGGR